MGTRVQAQEPIRSQSPKTGNMLDASIIAAIVTGILALGGVLATAWMSKWNEHRRQARVNKTALSQSFVPLVSASWDLCNWLYDLLEESNYAPVPTTAYGVGWSTDFTMYLLGRYLASVHIINEKTHLFAHIRGTKAEMLKKLLWKIQNEFVSMDYEGRESLEMRWFEGDILAVQEHLIEVVSDGEGPAQELRIIGWVAFQKKLARTSGPGSVDSSDLSKVFEWYGDELQRIIYRRFKSLYKGTWSAHHNPQDFHLLTMDADEDTIKKWEKEESMIRDEQQQYPGVSVIVPDHRLRRLQHLLSDLVEVLDAFTAMNLNRPVRRCRMWVGHQAFLPSNPLNLVTAGRIPCDCNSLDCNPKQVNFAHRSLPQLSRSR